MTGTLTSLHRPSVRPSREVVRRPHCQGIQSNLDVAIEVAFTLPEIEVGEGGQRDGLQNDVAGCIEDADVHHPRV